MYKFAIFLLLECYVKGRYGMSSAFGENFAVRKKTEIFPLTPFTAHKVKLTAVLGSAFS
jgi:hypothetical protein